MPDSGAPAGGFWCAVSIVVMPQRSADPLRSVYGEAASWLCAAVLFLRALEPPIYHRDGRLHGFPVSDRRPTHDAKTEQIGCRQRLGAGLSCSW